MEPILESIPDAGTTIGVGRSSVYELIRDGKIETVKIGKRHLVVVESLRAYVAALRAGGNLPPRPDFVRKGERGNLTTIPIHESKPPGPGRQLPHPFEAPKAAE